MHTHRQNTTQISLHSYIDPLGYIPLKSGTMTQTSCVVLNTGRNSLKNDYSYITHAGKLMEPGPTWTQLVSHNFRNAYVLPDAIPFCQMRSRFVIKLKQQ